MDVHDISCMKAEGYDVLVIDMDNSTLHSMFLSTYIPNKRINESFVVRLLFHHDFCCCCSFHAAYLR
jgi:hypothetical protein